MSRCKSCDAEIEWVSSQNGKMMPLSVASAEQRFIIDPSRRSDPAIRAVKFVPTYISHFADCPNADQHRKGASE